LKTKVLALTIYFAAVTILLNPRFSGLAIPSFLPRLWFQFWEITVFATFLLIGFKPSLLVAALNTIVLLLISPGVPFNEPFSNLFAVRGTLISLSMNEHLLYTTGYTPRVRTYPGHRIPRPLIVKHSGDSEIKLICSEILGLTKLNWNTTAFSTQLPITLEFSRRVGKVLSEIPPDVRLQDHYRFYM
jgi:hypothetical protein